MRPKYRNVRVWSRERFVSGPGKETCLKNKQTKKKQQPNSLKAFSKALALGGEGVVSLVVTNFLVWDSLFLQVST